MKITRTGAALLVGAGFAAGCVAGPANLQLSREFGIPQAAAQGDGQLQTSQMLRLFNEVVDRIRTEYVEPVSDRSLMDNALQGMLSGLDPHSSYLNEQQWHDMQTETSGRFGGIGLEVTDRGGLLQVVSPIDGTPAAQAGVKPGDLITAVNGRTVEGLSLTDAVNEMRGEPDTVLKLTLKRQGQDQPVVLTLTRQIIHVKTVTSRLMGRVGVVRISEFTDQTNSGLRAAIEQLRSQAGGRLQGLVLDLRNDPGGLLDQAIAVSNDFLDQGRIVSTRGRLADDNKVWTASPGGDLMADQPIVVVTNNGTASAAEIVAGALQDDHRALVLGTRSFGKGSVQTLIPLQGAGAMRLTTARYYTPSGRSIQGLGIVPDVEVQASRTPEPHFGPEREADLRHILSNPGAGKDEQPPPARPLPTVAQQIQKLPPPDWPALDPTKPATDFQLQQALVLVRGMAGTATSAN